MAWHEEAGRGGAEVGSCHVTSKEDSIDIDTHYTIVGRLIGKWVGTGLEVTVW